MKQIIKHSEPSLFSRWKAANPTVTYKDLQRDVKCALKQALIEEQGYLCCYCECRISDVTSHIEHFKPKGKPTYASLQLDYENLFASCTKRPTGAPEEHCGHKKGDAFMDALVSPLEADCASHFTYTLNGHIVAKDQRGSDTISLLHLDSELLNQQRQSLLDYFLEMDGEEVSRELDAHLVPDAHCLGEFYSMIDSLKEILALR